MLADPPAALPSVVVTCKPNGPPCPTPRVPPALAPEAAPLEASIAAAAARAGSSAMQAPLDLQVAAALYAALVAVALVLALGALRRLRGFRDAVEQAVLQRLDGSLLAGPKPPAELAPVAHMVERLMGDFRFMAGQMRTVADDGAHAMRTPLATVTTALHAIRRHLPADDIRAQRTMRIIDLSLDRLSHLVDAAQVHGQSIAALIAAPRRRLDLAASVSGMVSRTAGEAGERRVRTQVRLADGCSVLANGEALEVALRDLLLSAINGSPEGAAVEIDLDHDGTSATLVVADACRDDCDVALLFEQEAELFLPEDQPTPRRPGLSGVRRTVEIMGGSVTASRNAAGGVSVALALPLAPPPAAG